MEAPKSEVIKALGRPFSIGYLYDIRRDMVINRSPWTNSELQTIAAEPQNFTDFKVAVTNSIDESMKLMDLSASLKMSFLGGLVEVSGSAKYLDKTNSTSNKTSVSLVHNMTTETRRLGEEQLSNITYPGVLDLEEATHVITGITYGASAFFKFEKEVGVDEQEKDVSGELEVAVKSIPGFQISGSGAVQMKEEKKKNFNNISCQFVGDYTGIGIPTDFENAIKVFNKIDSGDGESQSKRTVVPVFVHLTPIQTIDSGQQKLVREISRDAVEQCSELITYFREVDTKLNTIRKSKAASYYPSISSFIQKVQNQFLKKINILKQKMTKILPRIRGGGAEENELLKMLKYFQSTIFSVGYFNPWFQIQYDEIKAFDSYLSRVEKEDFTIVKTDGELATQMNDFSKGGIAVSANFVPIQNEKLLSDLEKADLENTAEYVYPVNDNAWYNNKSFLGKFFKCQEAILLAFKVPENKENFAFFFEMKNKKTENSCSIQVYEGGAMVDEDFELNTEALTIKNICFNNETKQVEGSNNSPTVVKKEIRFKMISETWSNPMAQLPELRPGTYLAQMRCVLKHGIVGQWLPEDPLQITRDMQDDIIFTQNWPIELKKNEKLMITKLPYIGTQYRISFDLLVTKLEPGPEIVLFFDLVKTNQLPVGAFVLDKSLLISSAFYEPAKGVIGTWTVKGPKMIAHGQGVPLVEDKWYTVGISQTLVGGKFINEILVNGEQIYTVENTQAEEFGPVEVFAGGDHDIKFTEGKIRNLSICTRHE